MDPSMVENGVSLDMGLIRGLITALTMVVYGGIFWWAYRRGNRERFEADALLPFADEGGLPGAVLPVEDER